MENFTLKIVDTLAHGSEAKTIRLGLDRDIPYRPGQYLMLTIKAGDKNVTKPITISSSPTEKGYIEFTKKMTGSAFSNAISAAKRGDELSVKMPFGKFIFDGQFEKAAFISGGIGITPIVPMLKYATDKNIPSSLILLYSGRTPEHLIFKDVFDNMQKANKHLRITYTVTDCGKDVPNCKTGRIDAKMIDSEIQDYRDRKFFICGPPAMVGAMRSVLMDDLSVDRSNIFAEDFFGY
ncbi:MAG: FAD-dependent oxidoreductase [Candidatus Omnitrophota bacterium]